MNTGHPSEIELQQYALEPSGCSTATLEHMEACSRCRAEAAAYRLLFTGIGDQPKASFDFDLSAAVLSRLPVGLAKKSNPVPPSLPVPPPSAAPISLLVPPLNPTPIPRPTAVPRISTPRFGPGAWSMGFLCCCTAFIPLYLFRKNIGSISDGMSGFFMYGAAAAAGIIVLSRLIAMYRNYLRQMETLNF